MLIAKGRIVRLFAPPSHFADDPTTTHRRSALGLSRFPYPLCVLDATGLCDALSAPPIAGEA
jgi:hypothetical protein